MYLVLIFYIWAKSSILVAGTLTKGDLLLSFCWDEVKNYYDTLNLVYVKLHLRHLKYVFLLLLFRAEVFLRGNKVLLISIYIPVARW